MREKLILGFRAVSPEPISVLSQKFSVFRADSQFTIARNPNRDQKVAHETDRAHRRLDSLVGAGTRPRVWWYGEV